MNRLESGPGLTLLAAALLSSTAFPAYADARSDALQALPENARALYTDAVDVGPARFADFKAPAKPWRWCHSESYMGNPWRVTFNDELARLVNGAKEAGDVSEFIVSDSNGDTTQQISQIRSFIETGCSVITTIAGSSTALNTVIEDAYKAGIPVITSAGAVTTPTAINVMHNQNLWGYQMGKGIAQALPNGGTILQVEGISGHPLVQQENDGLEKAVAESGHLTVARKVSGEWTGTTTKSAVLQALATTPQQIDAVWSTGSEARFIAEAFQQAGRPLPLIAASISGDALGYWHENQDAFKFYGGEVSPHVAAQNAFRVALRVVSGQKPIVNTIIAPMPTITQADLPTWYKDCMKPDSAAIFPIPPQDPFQEDLLNAYFTNGEATPLYDFSKVPASCTK
ncbi:ribose ABC transporter substrate-binding protein [Rhizobium sp. Root73]|uniref:substrate-binding domain-containing protein n=1 Tax=unclassified Rhizobium TaxID=2613769 RepID=UPI00072A996A|nr:MULTISPECIES: substrate-binding domain-containing protein [unclassified Rhizobium]KQY16783.1 ribose ABC transporter substrate-binding protein [Rhizobium sp. Root1334]KRC11343.1 ribose ABC transporter substrate-binding protein [Rhizobium sp. Root73]